MKVNRVADYINKSKGAQNTLKYINKNPAMVGAASSFVLAAVMRPALIGAIPFKEKKDKTYSQASSVAAGIVELGASATLFTPLQKQLAKSSDNLYKATGTIFEKNPPALRQFKSVTNRSVKVLSLIPISLLRFSLVKPVVDLLYPDKTKSLKLKKDIIA